MRSRRLRRGTPGTGFLIEPTPGLTDSAHHIYLAEGAERIGPPEDDYESDHVAWMPLADVPALIASGQITSGTTLAALLYATVSKAAAPE